MASSSSSNSPCAACKFLRRKCMPGCIFAPYFPPEEPQKFANVHKIFGASNVTKLLNELLPHQREDAVNSLAYEAEARMKDPVYGCVGAISFLQREVHRLEKELEAANADLLRYACNEIPNALPALPGTGIQMPPMIGFGRRMNNLDGNVFQNSSVLLPYPPSWTHNASTDINDRGGGSSSGGNII
ncbi:putative elongator complex protein 1 [Ranunculus cassubicifolius]